MSGNHPNVLEQVQLDTIEEAIAEIKATQRQLPKARRKRKFDPDQ